MAGVPAVSGRGVLSCERKPADVLRTRLVAMPPATVVRG